MVSALHRRRTARRAGAPDPVFVPRVRDRGAPVRNSRAGSGGPQSRSVGRVLRVTDLPVCSPHRRPSLAELVATIESAVSNVICARSWVSVVAHFAVDRRTHHDGRHQQNQAWRTVAEDQAVDQRSAM